jgi:ABC-type multidrug transport system fused ATPase/permease subunit
MKLNMKNRAREYYAKQVDTCLDKIKRERKKLLRLSLFRFLFFIGGGGLCFYLFSVSAGLGILCFLVLASVFGKMVHVYQKHTRYITFLEDLCSVNKQESAVLEGEYSVFENGEEFLNPEHSFTYDLDVFGEGSVFQYLNRAKTFLGRNRLASWLQNPLRDSNAIYERQEAIKELSEDVVFRQKMMAFGMSIDDSSEDLNRLEEWIDKDCEFSGKWLWRVFAFGVPVLMLTALVIYILGVISFSQLLLISVFPFYLTFRNLKNINAIHAKVGKNYERLLRYSELIMELEKKEFKSDFLVRLHDNVKNENRSASGELRKLARAIKYLDNRYNVLIAILGNMFLMWDLNTIMYAEKCKKELAGNLRDWFDVIADFEAVSSLSNLSFNYPEYVFPEISQEGNVFEMKNGGHILLDENVRVNNSCELNNSGQFIIITGPNMAGKSTFLRMIGLNYVLGMMGSVVCADQFVFSCKQLYTSMRTSDSLQKNESYFYAELKRLKNLVAQLREGEKLFIVLDEILKGTNSKDKQEGSKLFLKQISELNAQGLVATHDLSLGDLETEFPEKFFNRSFEMEIENDELIFDYKLKSGLTNKMNASILMKRMGIV